MLDFCHLHFLGWRVSTVNPVSQKGAVVRDLVEASTELWCAGTHQKQHRNGWWPYTFKVRYDRI